MQREWQPEELIEQWTLLPKEEEMVRTKRGPVRLGFAVLLKYFQYEGRFPARSYDVPKDVVAYLAQLLNVPVEHWTAYDWDGRTIKYHRAEIHTWLGFREATVADGEAMVTWLCAEILPTTHQPEHVEAAVYDRFRALRIEPPTADRVLRLVKSALSTFEQQFSQSVVERLTDPTRERLEALLTVEASEPDTEDSESGQSPSRVGLHELRADSGRATLDNLLREIAKLERVRNLALPADLFANVSPKVLQAYRRRAAVEAPYELRRHTTPLRLTLLAVFCFLRSRELTDTLVELLIELVHRIGARAERRVEKELLEDLKRVSGKTGMLFRVAEAALGQPEGLVKEVVFPVINEATLRALVKEWKATGPVYRTRVQTVMRSSYRTHYRRMLPRLLQTLTFRSNNTTHQPVIQALELLKTYAQSTVRTYPRTETVPLDGVVRELWQDVVIVTDEKGRTHINRVEYELCVLQALREQLRCKEIWVVGADRFRNPDEDVPRDFAVRRASYYDALHLPQQATEFVQQIQQELREELAALNRSLPRNQSVEILKKAGGWIKLSPLEAQPEPTNILALKAELGRRWPMTSLLDILKETDLRVDFTQHFRGPTAREMLDRATLQYRILLCLYGLGTNTGLKRMQVDYDNTSYKDLLYTRRRFLTPDALREAISGVVNQTFQARLPHIWGEGTTACASDARKFGAWDQNLMTEWHVRYGGRGIMIYWHVERKAACIYSQLKTCSSSEVAAMMEGVLRHCTEMEVEKNYVDSHGQSVVAFAFSHLLGFQLLPRLKAIHKQRLYRPEAGQPDAYPHLQPVLSRPINWDLIVQQYDNMVKYATALRLGTATTEAILRRFTRQNVQHPTYKALVELGMARKTIFLCRYLRLPLLRQEIQEGLNVVESWNGANDFILFGRGGEFATNRQEAQELTMLALHLLQSSLVYINTLMLQRVLGEPAWEDRLTPEDRRALTPLFYGHVTPYGTFHLDLNTRLNIEQGTLG
jgi:TnpA family transposase